jgi:hypothetical protein
LAITIEEKTPAELLKMGQLPLNYYDSGNVPYFNGHTHIILEKIFTRFETCLPLELSVNYSDTTTKGLATIKNWLKTNVRVPIDAGRTYNQFAIHTGIPSPTGYGGPNAEVNSIEDAPINNAHAVALFITTHPNAEIHYQDSYGLRMPLPLLCALNDVFPEYTIFNHRMRQQPPDDYSCAALAIHNLERFCEGTPPLHAPDIEYVRAKQRPHLKQAVAQINKKMRDIYSKNTPLILWQKSQSSVFAAPISIVRFWQHDFPFQATVLPKTSPVPIIYSAGKKGVVATRPIPIGSGARQLATARS